MATTRRGIPGTEWVREATRLDAQLKQLELRQADVRLKLTAKRRAAWLRANRAGLTYAALAHAVGYSERFVCKEIATARRELGEGALHRNASNVDVIG